MRWEMAAGDETRQTKALSASMLRRAVKSRHEQPSVLPLWVLAWALRLMSRSSRCLVSERGRGVTVCQEKQTKTQVKQKKMYNTFFFFFFFNLDLRWETWWRRTELTLRGHLSGIPEAWLFYIHPAAVAPSMGKIPSSFAGSQSTPIHLNVATAQRTYVRMLQEIGWHIKKNHS